MKLTKILALLMAVMMLVACCTACGEESTTSTTDKIDSPTNSVAKDPVPNPDVTDVYTDKEYGFQTEMPTEGETVAILHTNMGDISIRFFPEAAPKAVENFLTHAKEGYYDGLIFHRVIADFMIQGGDPKGTGTGGESIWGEPFEDEFDKKLMNIRGSLAMANGGPKTNGSQFFINQGKPTATAEQLKSQYDYEKQMQSYQTYYKQFSDTYGESFTAYYPDLESFVNDYLGGVSPDSRLIPDEVWEVYAKEGGNIHLDGAWRSTGGHAVFGQVYDGMDVVDAIAAVETDDNDKPVKDVIIKSIEVTEYKK